jgi:hypothetical protein
MRIIDVVAPLVEEMEIRANRLYIDVTAHNL